MKARIVYFSIFLLICIQHTKAQVSDTVFTRKHYLPERIVNSEAYRMTHISVPLMAVGLSTINSDKRFRSMRNSYVPTFKHSYDDYLQYAPAALLVGLKVSGVEGASTWEKMLVADAFSVSIMAITVNSLKFSTSRMRPDRSDKRSFPSGHTATAFMTATMLHKEYGMTRSPFYSIAGYSMAAATGVTRQLNNKHWFSDVLVGAGIGIVSTEMGYFLADQIFRDKGRVRQDKLGTTPYVIDKKYGYLGIQTGYIIGSNAIKFPNDIEIGRMRGSYAALTGGGYFSDHWGITGKFAVSQTTPEFKYDRYFATHPEIDTRTDQILIKPLNYSNLVLGMEYSTQVIPGIHVGGSVMGGIGWSGQYQLDLVSTKDPSDTHTLFKASSHAIPNIDVTCFLQRFVNSHMGIKLFFNYNLGFDEGHYVYRPVKGDIEKGVHKRHAHHLTFGADVSALFWRK